MAFQPPSTKQELQNRRILEDLNQKKQQLMLKQQTSIPSGSVNGASSSQNVSHPAVNSDLQPMSSSQRAALQHAHANSVGFFIPQDSSFGNLILPVLPRFDK